MTPDSLPSPQARAGSTANPWQQGPVGIVGLGLIGGSLGLDLQHQGVEVRALVHREATAERARQRLLATEVGTNPALLAGCSLVVLAQRFAQRHVSIPSSEPPIGRMLWFTSGQHIAPMDGEIAYAVSKGALHQMTRSIDHALSRSRIVANCINPGPVDTGYADDATRAAVAAMFPDRRWGTPDDVANLVGFLVSDAGAWIRGQVLDSEGGFDRFSHHLPIARD